MNIPPFLSSPPPATIILDRVRAAHAAGMKAIQEPAKQFLRPPFLQRAIGVLVSLYGSNANIVQKYKKALTSVRTLSSDEFGGLVIEFEHFLDSLSLFALQEGINPNSKYSPPPVGRNVFIVHGHDETNALRLQILLHDYFKVKPVVMKKEAGMSRALLTKFEDVASFCSFAFVLMTPDDEITNRKEQFLQARPNVIFEAGWFVGRLGISRVCLLLKDGTEVHSDIDGISRIPFRDNVEEKVVDIQKELTAVGL